ncbi:MAG: single-stranded-DNA-specific exonuclease RecJ, partial [Clostridia bacterium]|nr:single-stranded-DNA-specific exonuclease RecJ [Clostridia bacterium]
TAIAKRNTDLIITVDTGITAVEEVEIARAMGIDMIITDHHECQSVLPNALIINPKQQDSGYPFAHLAGVGVVYKLVCALNQRLGNGRDNKEFIALAAIGTVADIMPMCGENRYIVREGLRYLRDTRSLGLQALLERCVGDRPIDTSAVGFMIAPRINAAGRMGDACEGVDLLITDDSVTASELVERLCRENNQRQSIENQILEEAVSMLENDPDIAARSAIVLWGEEWHNGVVGIVASRLKERYGKPCILFSIGDDYAKGSGRSIRPFNLFDALGRISEHTIRFGGHAYAAGVLVDKNELVQFREAFIDQVDRFLEKDTFDECIEVDCVLRTNDLSLDSIEALGRLAPFGRNNETPIFCLRDIRIIDAVPTANGNHMRLSLACGTQRITAFYFNVSKADFCYRPNDRIDIVFEADINTYNGRKSVQLLIKDVHCCASKDELFRENMKRIKNDLRLSDIPDRQAMGILYRFLYKSVGAGYRSFDLSTVSELIEKEQLVSLNFSVIYHSFRILKELGVLTYDEDDNRILNLQIHSERHVELENSELLKSLREKAGEPACV